MGFSFDGSTSRVELEGGGSEAKLTGLPADGNEKMASRLRAEVGAIP
jgi:hypothetical protein